MSISYDRHMKTYQEIHILALDARRSRLGYAVFSGPKLLLDWGTFPAPPQGDRRNDSVTQRLATLIRQCSPAVVVVKVPRRLKANGRVMRGRSLATVHLIAREHRVPVRSVDREEIQWAFRIFGSRTKDDVACVLVGIFPELLVCLPPKRKVWQSEPHRMIIFDAIATGFAYFQRPPPRE
jgi:hypothetical protein